MDAGSLEELSSHFEEKLSRLTGVLAIEASLHHSNDDVRIECHGNMKAVWSELDDLSVILTLMRTHLAEQRKALEGIQDVKKKMAMLIDGLQHANNHLPAHLPPVHVASATRTSAPVQTKETIVTVPTSVTAHSEGNRQGNGMPSLQPVQEKSVPTSKQQNHIPCPLMEYLTVEEFGDVPKYMKGRLAYQQVNTFINEVNKVFKTKYKLLRQKKSTLSDANRKRYESLKMQESKDTAGVYFVTEEDLKEWSSIKMSKENRSILTVLRHCGRMYEIRSGSLVRYAMVDMY